MYFFFYLFFLLIKIFFRDITCRAIPEFKKQYDVRTNQFTRGQNEDFNRIEKSMLFGLLFLVPGNKSLFV